MKEYAIIIEKTGNGYGAYVPDLPGCVAGDPSFDETLILIKGAISMHLAGMAEDGEELPEPTTFVATVQAT